MFKRNDKALRISRIIFIVIIVIIAVLSLVTGIILAVDYEEVYFLFTFVGWFLCWIMWVFTRLYLSYLVDIKLIRNKLYGESNEELEVFLKAKEDRSNSSAMKGKKQSINAELEYLQKLLNSGVITLEEFEKRKEELTKDI